MEYNPEDNDVVRLLKKLQDTNGAYPQEMLVLRRQGYLRQVAQVSAGTGLLMGLKNAGETGWQTVSDGERVVTGQRLRTGPGGQVTLLFFDGSRTTLGPKTDLTLTRVDGGWGKVIHVVLDQSAGKTAHSVAPFGERDSSFMVFTPSGAASVPGTRFNVAVGQQGKARFAVEAGQVLVTNLNSARFLGAGPAVAVQAGIPLEVAMYQFSLRGKVGRLQGDRWYIQGAAFAGTPETGSAGGCRMRPACSLARGVSLRRSVGYILTRPRLPRQAPGLRTSGEPGTISGAGS